MDAAAAAHPQEKTLQSYGLGQLDAAAAGPVRAHLESCPDCRRRVAELSSEGSIRGAPSRPDPLRPAVSSTDGLSMPGSGPVAPAPPPASTLPPGLAEHPDYEVLRELGRGGMGVVYLAQNTLMGRMEVLKVVGGHLISRPAVLERFLREIRSAARLHHPNIVVAYSALRLGEGLVLTMEYVDGLDLSRLVKASGPLPVAHASNYVHQAALGLQHAHEHGMVHRDIKPANLILARAGGRGNRAIVKVLDFGLAKVTSEGQADSNLTREGQMLGTPDYIAPEQIRDAQSADIRADIYSLGCTLYYLLTGQAPFHGDNLWDLYQAHFSMDAAPLNLVRPEVPVELAALVAKMMAKEPERRFQQPRDVAQALAPFFKKGEAVASSPVAGVSQVGPDAAAQAAQAIRTAAPPSRLAHDPVPVLPPPLIAPAESARSSPGWQSRPASEGTDRPSQPDAAVIAPPRRRPPWAWPAIVAASVLGVLAIIVLIAVMRPDGRSATRELVTRRGEQADPGVASEPTAVDIPPKKPPIPPPARTALRGAAEPRTKARAASKPPGPLAVARPKAPPAPVTLRFCPGVDGYAGLSVSGHGEPGPPRTSDSPFLWVDWPDPKSPDPLQHGGVTILRFDDLFGRGAGRVPPGSNVIGAKLRLVTGSGPWARGHGARIHRLKKAIDFGDVMNTLLRDADSRRFEIIDPPTARVGSPNLQTTIEAGPIEIDVTADVRAWASATPNHGWALLPWPNGRDAWAFLKPDCPEVSDRPTLSVTFTPPATGQPVHVAERASSPPSIADPRDPAPATIAFPEPGFTSLFNGRDLTGWTGFANSKEVDPYAHARVSRGEIILVPTGGNGGGLRTSRIYRDFILKLEYLFPVGGILNKPGSGVIILPDTGAGLSYQQGIEFQIRTGESGDLWAFAGASLAGQERHGQMGKVARKLDAEKPPGQWNAVVIRCEGSRITYELNGREVNRAAAGSSLSGWIGLMNQGSDIHFRHIQIRELSPGPKPPAPASPRLSVVGKWRHAANAPNANHGAIIELVADGSILNARGVKTGTWSLRGTTLVLRWPNKQAPGGAWLDTVKLSPNWQHYNGKNQGGVVVHGARAE